ncbi:HD domain-containing protein [Butyrivibrio sp. DSM 10294]|nr:HD domain-containing protein [Butyrivibrio sp. DSM 10294]
MAADRLSKIKIGSFGQHILLSLIGIIVNVVLAYAMYSMGYPLFLDTIGTVAVAAVGGLFPGILTAVVTNAICALFNVNAIYYSFMNAMIAIFSAWLIRRHSIRKLGTIITLMGTLTLFSGSISAVINWFLLEGKEAAADSDTVLLFTSSLGIPAFFAFFIYSILLNTIDKGIAVFFAWLIVTLVPSRILEQIELGNWKQRALPQEEINTLNSWGKDMRYSMRLRTTLMILLTSILLVIVTGWSGISMYFSKTKDSMTVDAENSLKLVAELISIDNVKAILRNGYSGSEYEETQKLLQTVANDYSILQSLYLIRFGEKEGHVIFEIEPSGSAIEKKDNVVEYDDGLMPFIPDILEGRHIDPIDHGDIDSWTRTVFYPIKDEAGECVCYAVADISITYMADYMQDFIVRSLLILMGFFILVIANNMWFTNTGMVYPIRSMAKCVDDFSSMGYDQEQLDKNVKAIRALEINTEDEIERLYDSICRMTLNLSEQMRDLRRLSETTAKMQDGLIITMADMVERRDSDTGEHIQKTALYVKIIVEGLNRKGYYAEKVTPKFMSDVVRSAPLHDIGKINIPDEILNKPGKLTPEEFEIMKTHAAAGKKIMENAISTVKGENYLKEARNMAAYHHERWDGKGYPEGLHGEVIPLSARIMAIADVFDALTSPRVYKPAFPLDEALKIITEESGKQFDPKCVEVFLEALPEVKVILKKYNNV